MIQSNGRWVVEEDEIVYGEYLDMVDKRVQHGLDLPEIA